MHATRLLALSLVACAVLLSALGALWPRAGYESGMSLRLETLDAGGPRVLGGQRASWPSHRHLVATPGMDMARPFRAIWEGTLLVRQPGTYLFTTRSDDGSWVWVGDVLVVDNGGLHGAVRRSGAIHIDGGRHRLRVAYEQHGGASALEVWMREPGGTALELAASDLQIAPTDRPAGEWRARALRRSVSTLIAWSWLTAYLSLLVLAGTWFFTRIERHLDVPRAGWLLGASLVPVAVLAATGAGWGLPADFDGWAPDELGPHDLLRAFASGLQPPWSSIYPPLQYYVLLPLAAVLDWVGASEGIGSWAQPGTSHLHLAMRLVTVVMSAGLLAGVYLVVVQWFDRAAALVAVWMGGTGLSFLYYAKTANVDVPYLYWTFLALACFCGYVRTGRASLVRWMALCAALAVATKDQAIGYFVLIAPALPMVAWWQARRPGIARRWAAALWQRTWLEACAIVLVVLGVVYQGPIAPQMLSLHIDAVRAARYAPMVEPSLAGHLILIGRHIEVLAVMLGPPVLLLGVAGVVRAAVARHWALLAGLAIPAVSYAAVFLAMARYTYDRFLLGVALLCVCAAAPMAVDLWRAAPARGVVRGLLVVAAVWTLMHGLTIDVLMLRDGRYTVERYMRERLDPSGSVGVLSIPQYLPRFDQRPTRDVAPSVTAVEEAATDYLVFSTQYARRFTADEAGRALLAALADGSLGYRQVLSYREEPPRWAVAWWWPHLHDRADLSLTNLDKVNPRIEVWERVE